MSIVGIIKAHKLASIMIGGVMAASGVTGAAFTIISAQEQDEDPKTSQLASESPSAEKDAVAADAKNENGELNEEIEKVPPTPTPSSTQSPSESNQSIPPSDSAQQAQPSVNYEQIKAECIATESQKHVEISKLVYMFNHLPAEEKAQYPGGSHQYTKKLVGELEEWRISSGCSAYVDRSFSPQYYN